MNGIGFAILSLLCAGAIISAVYPWEIRFTKRPTNKHEGQAKP